jgi:hypothetical protein
MSEPNTPHERMNQFIEGQMICQAIGVAAQLSIADRIKERPRGAGELAAECEVNPDALYRLLRTLSAVGVFTEEPGRVFANSPLSETLMSDAAESLRGRARWYSDPLITDCWRELRYSVKTGETVFSRDHPGQGVFELIEQNPNSMDAFHEAMTNYTLVDGRAVCDAYDFTTFARIVDVGGGAGLLASLIAECAPASSVTLFDLPAVVERAKLGPRVASIAGDMFESVPGPSDALVLKSVLCDWDDDDVVRILRACREALATGGKLLICDRLMNDGPTGRAVKIVDLAMLAVPGGRVRTEEEFRVVLQRAGFALESVTATKSMVSVLTAVPV